MKFLWLTLYALKETCVVSSTRGFNLEKCKHASVADVNACPYQEIFVL